MHKRRTAASTFALGFRRSKNTALTTFTDKFVRGLKPAEKPYEERYGGSPGLLFRVNGRSKVWQVVASVGGWRRRIRLGTYPDVPLAVARRLASERKASPAIHGEGMRVADLREIYAAGVGPTRRSFDDVRLVWGKWAEPIIARVRLGDLTLRHGAELIAHVTKRSSPNRARKVVRYLSPMLSCAAGRSLGHGDPWKGLHLPEGVERRDRVLTRDECSKIWTWAVLRRKRPGSLTLRG